MNSSGSEATIEAGVPQGSCLSPALYALYTDDIPTLKDRLQESERDVVLALFADDSAYLSTSGGAPTAAKRMQKLLDILPDWLDKWRMEVNVGKTAAILFSKKHKHPKALTLRGQEMEWQSTVKYLGVHLDRRLTMAPQVEHVIRQARSARALLRPVLNSSLQLNTKLGIYKTYIRPRLTYAAPAWYSLCSRKKKTQLQQQQNIVLRIITGAGRYVRNDVIARDLKIESVESFIVRTTKKMFDVADNGPHQHLQGIAPLHARPPDAKTKWHSLPRELLAETEED